MPAGDKNNAQAGDAPVPPGRRGIQVIAVPRDAISMVRFTAKRIMLLALGCALMVCGVLTVMDALEQDDDPCGEYDYELCEKSEYTFDGKPYTPDEGNVYVVASGVLKNISYGAGISDNNNHFELVLGEKVYRCGFPAYPHKCMPGETLDFEHAFEVPAALAEAEKEAELRWCGTPSDVVCNPSLLDGAEDRSRCASGAEPAVSAPSARPPRDGMYNTGAGDTPDPWTGPTTTSTSWRWRS